MLAKKYLCSSAPSVRAGLRRFQVVYENTHKPAPSPSAPLGLMYGRVYGDFELSTKILINPPLLPTLAFLPIRYTIR